MKILEYSINNLLPLNLIKLTDNRNALKKLIKKHNFKIVVEVGAYVGYTTVFLAEFVQKVYAIDTFEYTGFGKHECLEPEKQFLSNIIQKGLQNKVITIKASSLEAANYFKKKGMHFDLIYLDADHKFESVMKDLKNWIPLGNIICGDDYIHKSFPEVKKAVNYFANTHHKKVSYKKQLWWYK